MKNKKGQALVEFIIIVPVLIMLIFCMVDFGKIFSTKSDLENYMSKVVAMKEDDKSIDDIKTYLNKTDCDCVLKVNNNKKDLKLELGKNIDIFTPGLNLVLGDPYLVTIKRVLPNE